jgi:hypothetical protein
VNSIKQRVPRLLPWLDQRRPDVLCVQETKLPDDAFTELLADELAKRGYEYAHVGEARWNGVAILSRVGLDDVVYGVAGAPGFPDPEARAVAATCGGIRVHSLYVPNGRTPDSDHYHVVLVYLTRHRVCVFRGELEFRTGQLVAPVIQAFPYNDVVAVSPRTAATQMRYDDGSGRYRVTKLDGGFAVTLVDGDSVEASASLAAGERRVEVAWPNEAAYRTVRAQLSGG